MPTANEIPTLAEAGVPGYEAVAWLMVVTRAGLPPDILGQAAWRAEGRAGAARGPLADRALRHDPGRFSLSPEELHRYVGTETVRWSKIVQQAGAAGIE